MNYLPLLIALVLVLAVLAFSARARRRQAEADVVRDEAIVVGSEVMTTSGLYGTVVARDDETDTVTLAVAPGVELKWAFAALREVSGLPERYRGAAIPQPAPAPAVRLDKTAGSETAS